MYMIEWYEGRHKPKDFEIGCICTELIWHCHGTPYQKRRHEGERLGVRCICGHFQRGDQGKDAEFWAKEVRKGRHGYGRGSWGKATTTPLDAFDSGVEVKSE